MTKPLFLLQAAQPHADGFLPHGFCYLWNPKLLWTHVTADLLIGLSYGVISFALAALVHRARQDIPFRVAFVAFGLFIIACGATHFVEVWTLWKPVYWFAGGVKVVTAIASVATAAAMPFMVPRVHATIRDARATRAAEIEAARMEALERSNALLSEQARALADRSRETEAALEAAERANKAKSDFLAVMSHELRTPLNAIGGYAQLLEVGVHGPVSETQRESLVRIRRSQEHLLTIIQNILNFTHAGTGRLSMDLRDVPLAQELVRMEELMGPTLSSKSLTYQRDPVAPDVVVRADPAKLQQILANLMSNALKFTPAGGTISVHVRPEATRVHIDVRDTGIGIAADKLEAIFEPFVQLNRSLSRPEEGVGLGLSISRSLARDMGGDLTVASAPGTGSVFTVILPRPARALSG